MSRQKAYPEGPAEEEMYGADRNIGLGRVIEWHKGEDHVSIEFIDENGYHCIGTFECACWTSSREGRAAAYEVIKRPPIATYYGRQARQRGRAKRRPQA